MRNPILVGERVYIRPLEESDAPLLSDIYAAESETFMDRGRLPVGPLAWKKWIIELHKVQPPRYIDFAVCLIENDQLIGYNGVGDIDWINRTGETESDFGPAEIRSQGYGTDAKHLLLEYCFDIIQLHAVRSEIFEPNTRSAAAVTKQGYRPAGRYRYADVKNGVFRDTLIFDLTRPEWIVARDSWRARRRG
ncbi:MAG TPA: GNAT family protein [Nitrolancea sp.]|nr:GNAT family protein [Nitrolancea sp.]